MTPDPRHRYLAFAWPSASAAAQTHAAAWAAALSATSRWSLAHRQPGLEVWTAVAARVPVRRLEPGGPVLIGDYVRRGPPLATRAADDGRAAWARRLLREGWGAYVGLSVTEEGELSVLCDPSGALPAYAWTLGEIAAVSDDVLHLPPSLTPADLALDWDAMAQVLQRPYLTAHLSPLAGFAVVSPGELRGVRAREADLLWSPGGVEVDPTPEAADRLRSAVLASAHAHAAPHRRLIVEVSGGLDSAIVAAALAATGARERIVAAVNGYAPDPEGDERRWARALCRRHGLPLVCQPMRDGRLEVDDYTGFAAHVGPAFAALDAERDRDLERLARELGADAILGGQGGDAVFFQMPTAAVVADHLRGAGPAGLLHPFPRQVARRLRRSIWSVLAEALGRRCWIGAAHPASRQFWGPRLRDAPAAPWHPWLRSAEAAAPAKQVQIAALLGTHEHWSRSRRARAAAVAQPLLAQPVVEAALAIPSWRLLEGGRDRALARRIFADLLPPSVAERRSKGMVPALYARRFAASLDALRPYLLDGVLVAAELLDRAAVEAALQRDALRWNADGARLGRALMMEAWARHWQGRAPDRPDAPRRLPRTAGADAARTIR